MSNCYLLTVDELAALITAGYTLNSGPHVTLGDCQVACGSGPTHTTTCCPDNAIADSLPIEFTGCATGTGTLTYSGASDPGVLDIWYGVVTLDCITMEVIVQCSEGVWGIYFPGDATCGPGTPSSTCDPFCVEFVIENLACIEADCPACAFPATLTIQIGCDFTPFTVTYDADATFTPDFTGNVQVECWGAGGLQDDIDFAAGGGGGGAYSKLNTYAVTSGSPYTVNVGTGEGDDTYFVSSGTVMAKSGNAPSAEKGGAGGAAGSGVGDTKYSGGNGANASGTNGGGGGGSAGSAGDGGNASGLTAGIAGTTGGAAGGNGGANTAGSNGSAPGGGGGGAGNSPGGNSGLGAPGRVIITRIS